MRKRKIVGLTFNRLTVVDEIEPRYTVSGRKISRYKCQCSCGNFVEVDKTAITTGNTKSCGCLHTEQSKKNLIKAQGVRAKTRKKKYTGRKAQLRVKANVTRAGCVARCYNSNYSNYHHYGGKGITVCDRWRYGENGKKPIECFVEDMGYPPTLKHTLERVDNSKNYCKENCIWATWKVQARHKSNTVYVTYKGVTKSLPEWAEELDMNYSTLRHRLGRLGWTVEEAFTTPVKKRVAA